MAFVFHVPSFTQQPCQQPNGVSLYWHITLKSSHLHVYDDDDDDDDDDDETLLTHSLLEILPKNAF